MQAAARLRSEIDDDLPCEPGRYERSARRKKTLAEAGGKHSAAHITAILSMQKGRCFYCNRLFGEDLKPTREHLLAVCDGGGDWPLNIVMACRSCNSSRADLPLRNYCKMLSPAQNRHILVHLVNRSRGLTYDEPTQWGLACFNLSLAQYDTTSFRYRCMKKMKAAKRNIPKNKPLPRSAHAIQLAYIKILRKELRELRAA
jgi:5-methylcytosine-specific restriction endonuclease McrA